MIISLSVEADQPVLLTGHCDGQDLQHWRMAMAIASAFFFILAQQPSRHQMPSCHLVASGLLMFGKQWQE